MTTKRIVRRTLLRTSLTGTALGAAAWAIPGVARVRAAAGPPESVQVAEIYQLQAAVHCAKTTQDLDLMMSLWAPDGTLAVQGPTRRTPAPRPCGRSGRTPVPSSIVGSRSSPPSRPRSMSTATRPGCTSNATDIGDYDLASRFIASDTFLAGTARHLGGTWVFADMTAGKSFPLSVDRYYFP